MYQKGMTVPGPIVYPTSPTAYETFDQKGSFSLPALPELSIAKKNEQVGAAKVALFAYDRESREPLWQSGVSTSMSDSDAFWLFGAGPFRRGTIYNGMQFAGSRVRLPQLLRKKRQQTKNKQHTLVSYQEEVDFQSRKPQRLPAVPEPAKSQLTEPERDAIALACRRAGLDLPERVFEQLCASAPYIEAMTGRLRRPPDWSEEPVNVFSFPG